MKMTHSSEICKQKYFVNKGKKLDYIERNKIMKNNKYLAIVSIIIVLCLVFSGCKNEQDNGKETQTTQKETERTDTVQEDVTAEEVEEKEPEVDLTGFSTTYTIDDFKDGYFIVSKHDGFDCALLDINGNEVIPFGQAVTMSFPQSKLAGAVIVNNEKKGLMDYSGNEILPIEYDSISNWGYNSEYYLAEKNGVQSIIGMDGTIVKELSGKYGGLISNAFLVEEEASLSNGYIMSKGNIYSFEEKLIDQSVCMTAYSLNNYYYKDESSNGDYVMAFLNVDGDIVLTFPTHNESGGEWYQDFESIGIGNLLSITYCPPGQLSPNYYKLVNPDQQTVSEKYYKKIVKADESTIYAISADSDTVDIYDENGEYVDTLEIGSSFIAVGNNNPLIATLSENYQFLNAEGEELQYEKFYNAEPLENFWIIVNDLGEFALMDEKGKIRIPYGELGGTSSNEWTDVEIESYNGEEIDGIYTFDDVFCIVTINDNESNVYLF